MGKRQRVERMIEQEATATTTAVIAKADGISEVAVRKRLKHAYRLLAVMLQEVAS